MLLIDFLLPLVNYQSLIVLSAPQSKRRGIPIRSVIALLDIVRPYTVELEIGNSLNNG